MQKGKACGRRKGDRRYGVVCLYAPLRRRQSVYRLHHGCAAAAPGASEGNRRQIHPQPPAGGTGLYRGSGRPRRRPAAGGGHQKAAPDREAETGGNRAESTAKSGNAKQWRLNFPPASDIINDIGAGLRLCSGSAFDVCGGTSYIGLCDGMADVTDSKSIGSDTVWIRVSPPAATKKRFLRKHFF